MTETKTETLADVLRELSSLAPDRFKEEDEWFYVHRWGTWRKATLIARLDDDRILGACMEECEARGWDMTLIYDADHKHWCTYIQDWSDYHGGDDFEAVNIAGWDAPDLADALATALRDALEASQ